MPTMLERLITNFWGHVNMKEEDALHDPNQNYGKHFCKLNFQPNAKVRRVGGGDVKAVERVKAWEQGVDNVENGQPAVNDGSGSFGLVKDVGHAKEGVLKMPLFVETKSGMVEFLKDLKLAIAKEKRISKKKLECMRLNVLKGANTLCHTDTMRCSMIPNHFILFPSKKDEIGEDSKFCLMVHKWPRFKTSIVLFEGRQCIPFHYEEGPKGSQFEFAKGKRSGGFLQMITFCSKTGNAKWLIVPPNMISDLVPYKRLDGIAVLGIRKGMIYITTKKYKIYETWNEVELKPWNEVVKSDIIDSIPKRKIDYLDVPYKLYQFNGWELRHEVEKGSDISYIRMHIFCRNIRPTQSCARIQDAWVDNRDIVEVVY